MEREGENKKWSIMLLYPDYSGLETFYTLSEAPTAIDGIEAAKDEMIKVNEWNQDDIIDHDHEDIEVILVLEGHYPEYQWRS